MSAWEWIGMVLCGALVYGSVMAFILYLFVDTFS